MDPEPVVAGGPVGEGPSDPVLRIIHSGLDQRRPLWTSQSLGQQRLDRRPLPVRPGQNGRGTAAYLFQQRGERGVVVQAGRHVDQSGHDRRDGAGRVRVPAKFAVAHREEQPGGLTDHTSLHRGPFQPVGQRNRLGDAAGQFGRLTVVVDRIGGQPGHCDRIGRSAQGLDGSPPGHADHPSGQPRQVLGRSLDAGQHPDGERGEAARQPESSYGYGIVDLGRTDEQGQADHGRRVAGAVPDQPLPGCPGPIGVDRRERRHGDPGQPDQAIVKGGRRGRRILEV